jgi:ubiquinone/menaquinone biosynthesis C-methylase UbiE
MNYDNELAGKASKYLLSQGIRVLQGNRFAQTEIEHLEKLADYMALNGEREVADMGCGFGEVSVYLSRKMPQTHFWLVNINQAQIEECPSGEKFTLLREDMCSSSIPDESVDLIMFNYSLCHVAPIFALREAARIGRDKARLFVYDYQRVWGDDELTKKHLSASFLRDSQFRGHALAAGWKEIETIPAPGDDTLFRAALGNDSLYEAMFSELLPTIWKAHL